MDKYTELTIQYFETFINKDYDKMKLFLKDKTQYLNGIQTYIGIDKIIEANKNTTNTNFEATIETTGKHEETITFAEVTFKQDQSRIFTIEWDNDYKINRIIGYLKL